MRIGVLALQGDFEAHQKAVERAGAEAIEVRTAAQMDSCDGLILPGGESTTMLKLLRLEGLFDELRRFGQSKPIFGTCAGAILLAGKVLSPHQESLGLVDLTVERNAYGRQIDSRIVRIEPESGASIEGPVEAVFIRAPIIRDAGPEVNVLMRYQEQPVLVEQGRHMVATFHPELTSDPRIHQRFLATVKKALLNGK
ncbi:MAG: pyridoxal 5'-phosphate synthase glutaminase subunit PdxT [Acidobacteria bacterium]|nr:pyridoxal 5'-phosphate synthase glutaminase subunit PdxT [Acidobacteriota bacterium]